MTRRDRSVLLVFLVAVGARFLFHYWTLFLADDAFITFRYAANIAQGLGFVYNEGEHVLGTSTPLFTFVLSALSLSNIPLPTLAVIVSAFVSGFTAVILYHFALRLRIVDWTIIPALAYALWPRSIPADAGGLETALFTLFIVAAFYYSHKRYGVYAVGMATLATLTRIEGAMLLFILILHEWRQGRDLWKPMLLTVLTLLLPWLIFATWYFGSPLPHSVTAKLALYGQFGVESVPRNLVYLLALHHPVGWVLILASLVGVRWLFRKQNWGGIACLWVLAMIAFYAFSRTHLFFWYVVPVYPILLLMAGGSLQYLSEKYAWWHNPFHAWARAIVRLGIVVVLLAGVYTTAEYYRGYQQALDSIHRSIGLYLSRVVEPAEIIAAEDIGYIGYYSGKRILDRDGLVSPEAVPYNRAGDYAGLVRDYSPDWVVAMKDSPISGFVNDKTFLQQYRIDKLFSTPDNPDSSATPITYLVYRRNDTNLSHE